MQAETIDSFAVISANLSNLLIVGIMLARPKGWSRLEYFLGLINLILLIPFVFILCFNLVTGRDNWLAILPALMVIFLLLEGLLDYVLKLPFRQSRWIWGYLLLFYLAQWAMIGYAFLVEPIMGFFTLLTYFLSLGATAYSYAKVGHGDRVDPGV